MVDPVTVETEYSYSTIRGTSLASAAAVLHYIRSYVVGQRNLDVYVVRMMQTLESGYEDVLVGLLSKSI